VKNHRCIRLLVNSLICLLLTIAAVWPSAVSAAGNAVVNVSVPSGTINPGGHFAVSINVTPNNAIAGMQFNFTYNPAIVAVDSVTEGNLLKQGGASTYFSAGTINNVTGNVSGVFGAITTPGQTVSTAGTFAILNMTAVSGGSSALTLSNVVIGDAAGNSIPATVNSGTVNINRPPVLNSIGNKTANEGALLTFTISATDPDGDTLTYSASNLPSGGAFNASTRTFSWTPGYTQAGSYPNVRFQVSDGSLIAAENITITVNNANRSPVLDPIGNKTVSEGALLTFTISATDPDGDTLTYSASNVPSGGAFNTSTRTFSWTPGYTQAGSYPNVRFQVSDGSLITAENITITVNNADRSPVLNSIGNKTVNEGVLITFTISATDPDGDTLTYSASNLPSGGTFNTSTRTFSWTPGFTQAGSYPNVRFQVSDGSLIAAENITITVNNVIHADLNNDGSINVLDIINVAQHFGESGSNGWIPQDVNEDGTINVLEVILIGQYWTA
jgi:hypothetical protein